MKILILGGSRFIGAHLAKELLNEGHEIVLLNRGKQKPLFDLDVDTIHCDREAIDSKRSEIESRKFDIAIDMMALHINNTKPVLSLLDGMVKRICVISSMDVYRVFDVVWELDPTPVDNSKVDERGLLRRRLFNRNINGYEGEEDLNGIYDKIPVEGITQKVKHSGWTICRLPAVYGPGDYIAWPRFCDLSRRIRDGRKRWVLDRADAQFRFTHGFVENVAQAIALAALSDEGANEIFNIGELDTPSYKERWSSICEVFDHRIEILEEERSKMSWLKPKKHANFAQHLNFSNAKIREKLGYQERVGLQEAYRRTVEWEMETIPKDIDAPSFNYEAEDAYWNSIKG